jgi:hypothetical protein
VRTLPARAVQENSDPAEGLWEYGEVAAHNPQMGPRQEVAARSRKAEEEENSDLAAGLYGEVAAHNPQMGPRQEVAARSQGAAARTQKVGAACSPEAHPPLASTYGRADQDNTPAGRRAVQPLQEPLQVHLEHNSHKAHDESRRRSLQPPESHQIGQIAVRPMQLGQRTSRIEA